MPVLAKAQKSAKKHFRLAQIEEELQEEKASEVDSEEYFEEKEGDDSDLMSDSDEDFSDEEEEDDEEEEEGAEEKEEDDEEGDDEEAKEKKIVLREPQAWVERMALTATKTLPEDLNVDDDPKREEVFVQHAMLSVRQGVTLLDNAKIAWRRPMDYYAQMFKSDVHMEKVQDSILKSKRTIESRASRRSTKDQKKFGKEVQAEALRQKAKAKREAVKSVDSFRKKRNRNDDDDDNFDMNQSGFGKGKEGYENKKGGKGGKGAPRKGAPRPAGASKTTRPGGKTGGKSRPGKSVRRGK